ncbi:Ima1 N-terminal domain-containing protein [Ampelomyces quisqualis]|uniref:Ima1 N-terminal domain-containing protein n=1 Tax=Ampelomyces quisqualis TaxID=50730 RepID=A0A6A5R359_AMPQU|nr:Ima1 N-terminal domain-containing protein [Ampelomyces quisqualis]
MAALFRRRLRCHYCNAQSRDSVAHAPRQYLCPQCDAVNHFDECGNIADPPSDAVAAAALRYTRAPSPAMSLPADSPFCDTCQRNQALLQSLVAEYLPDEDDPEYATYEAAFDGYRAELEERWPPVCRHCAARVDDQIRGAGYAAKADHLRRLMEKSEQKRRTVHTARQAWTLRLISSAKWTYICSLLGQVLWHAFGYLMAADARTWDAEAGSGAATFSWYVCLRQAIHVREVDECCVRSPSVTKLVVYALAADLLTLWWNPKLEAKTNTISGRMRGLKSLWAIRVAVFALRCGSVYYCNVDRDPRPAFHNTHLFMLIVMPLSLVLTFKTVRISYQSPALFREKLSSAPTSPGKAPRAAYKPAHPQANAFDTMAHGFTTSFSDALDTPTYPPSPTLTDSSYNTRATEATTPFGHKSICTDDMDWTPTQRKFAPVQPTVHPSPWNQQHPSPPHQTTSREPVSLFRKPDSNPFRHKIPAAPKAPAQVKADPWKRGVWDPPLKETTPNFFRRDKQARGAVGEAKGLDGVGVPKNVKRDAELFASPKLKYDNYGTMKSTGLEDRFEETFNDFFSK